MDKAVSTDIDAHMTGGQKKFQPAPSDKKHQIASFEVCVVNCLARLVLPF